MFDREEEDGDNGGRSSSVIVSIVISSSQCCFGFGQAIHTARNTCAALLAGCEAYIEKLIMIFGV